MAVMVDGSDKERAQFSFAVATAAASAVVGALGRDDLLRLITLLGDGALVGLPPTEADDVLELDDVDAPAEAGGRGFDRTRSVAEWAPVVDDLFAAALLEVHSLLSSVRIFGDPDP